MVNGKWQMRQQNIIMGLCILMFQIFRFFLFWFRGFFFSTNEMDSGLQRMYSIKLISISTIYLMIRNWMHFAFCIFPFAALLVEFCSIVCWTIKKIPSNKCWEWKVFCFPEVDEILKTLDFVAMHNSFGRCKAYKLKTEWERIRIYLHHNAIRI